MGGGRGEIKEEECLQRTRDVFLWLSPAPNQRDKVMSVRAFVISANPSSRYFIRFGIWLSALIRCAIGHSVNKWHTADNEKSLHLLAVALDTSALETVLFTCTGFYLMMIQLVCLFFLFFFGRWYNVCTLIDKLVLVRSFGLVRNLLHPLFLSLSSLPNFSSTAPFFFIPHFFFLSLPFALHPSHPSLVCTLSSH